LDDLDEQFKELESIIEKQTNEYLNMVNELSNCERQLRIVDLRKRNQEVLKESKLNKD